MTTKKSYSGVLYQTPSQLPFEVTGRYLLVETEKADETN